METITIDIEPASRTRYAVWIGDEVLIASSRDPFHEAARALEARGITGRLAMRRRGRDQIDMVGTIEGAAKFSTGEEPTCRRIKYEPFLRERVATDAVQ